MSSSTSPTPTPQTTVQQDDSIQYLKGIGPKRFTALKRLGYETVGQLFYFYPRRYEDRSHFCPIRRVRIKQFVTIQGQILEMNTRRIKRLELFEMTVGDSSGTIIATWFNQGYLRKTFNIGDTIILSGRVDYYQRIQLSSPEYEVLINDENETIHTGRITPVYPLTEGLWQRAMRTAMKQLIDLHADNIIHEFLPSQLIHKLDLLDLPMAIKNIHFPESSELFERAQKRLIFDELFLFQMALEEKRKHEKVLPAPTMDESNSDEFITNFEKTLPFNFTESQKKVTREIINDFSKKYPMRRLLQGDVGSGKTLVAVLSLLKVAQEGLQGVLLVPTEILAEQHYKTIKKILEPFDLKIRLLTGSQDKAVKTNTKYEIKTNTCNIVIGTHALLQEGIDFPKLGLLVVDEQHKFGVRQRAHLIKESAKSPHLLVMTATPIPRTLGLTLYGDLEISTINEMPKGRQPIKTYWITKKKETDVFKFIAERLDQGQQAYMVFPAIEESEKLEIEAAEKAFKKLQKEKIFKNFSIGLVHGRLDSIKKDTVMKQFHRNEIQVLIATSVIEVGIDNPNATMIVVQNAERFGLSSLHQLRGRVGRGDKESFCFLFGNPKTDEGKRRLRVLTKTNDGFKVAEEDLLIRGPGDILGTRQHGIPQFVLANLIRDFEMLQLARSEAEVITKNDPELLSDSLGPLKYRLEGYMTYYQENYKS